VLHWVSLFIQFIQNLYRLRNGILQNYDSLWNSEMEKVVFKCMNQLAVSMGGTLGWALTRRGSPQGFWLPVKTLTAIWFIHLLTTRVCSLQSGWTSRFWCKFCRKYFWVQLHTHHSLLRMHTCTNTYMYSHKSLLRMHTCTYTYMCTHYMADFGSLENKYVYIHVYTYTYMYIHIHTCLRIYIHVYTYTYMYTHIHTCIQILAALRTDTSLHHLDLTDNQVLLYVCMYICMYVCAHVDGFV
jgi:hypothetical protein